MHPIFSAAQHKQTAKLLLPKSKKLSLRGRSLRIITAWKHWDFGSKWQGQNGEEITTMGGENVIQDGTVISIYPRIPHIKHYMIDSILQTESFPQLIFNDVVAKDRIFFAQNHLLMMYYAQKYDPVSHNKKYETKCLRYYIPCQ